MAFYGTVWTLVNLYDTLWTSMNHTLQMSVRLLSQGWSIFDTFSMLLRVFFDSSSTKRRFHRISIEEVSKNTRRTVGQILSWQSSARTKRSFDPKKKSFDPKKNYMWLLLCANSIFQNISRNPKKEVFPYLKNWFELLSLRCNENNEMDQVNIKKRSMA